MIPPPQKTIRNPATKNYLLTHYQAFPPPHKEFNLANDTDMTSTDNCTRPV